MSQSTILPALTGAERWDVYFEPEHWGKLEELLPGYMRPRRWFSGKARTVAETQVQAAIPLEYAGGRAFLTLLRVAYADGHLNERERHTLWRLSDLLHVPHGAYIHAKMRAKAASGAA